MTKGRRPAAVVLLVLLALSGCGGAAAQPEVAVFPPDSAEARGAALFRGEGRCATCHALSPGTVIVGPSLAGIADVAAERRPGMSAAAYLEQSILDPDAYRPPGFEEDQMDTTLGKTLTVQQLDDIVAYLLTLSEVPN